MLPFLNPDVKLGIFVMFSKVTIGLLSRFSV